MMQADFLSCFSLPALLKEYGVERTKVVCVQLGYDGNVYILLSSRIPDRIDGMFVNTRANSEYTALILTVDWHREEIVGHACRKLGMRAMNYHMIQPLGQDLLLVGARCLYSPANGPEMNAAIVDPNGNTVREFCLGDGIAHCIVTAGSDIITSYFDEGIFGNYGWEDPIGSPGLIIWNRQGDILWQAGRDITDCYAINLDAQDRLWYYYYTDFLLVRTDRKTETEFDPGMEGATGFLITGDGRHVVFENEGAFFTATLTDARIGDFVPLALRYGGGPLSVQSYCFLKSNAVFVDNSGRLFLKRFSF